ncbi:MAG: YqiA/YcfP family alpha/beta fold hydrolase [Casimicrobiaceae bacterium]
MTRTTIVYLHGFNSSAQSIKGRKIAAAASVFADPPLVYLPTLHHDPSRAMRDVCTWVDANVADLAALTFVGSSLGGYYASWLAEKFDARAIVINPAVQPATTLRTYGGPQRNLHTGEAWHLTPAHFAALDALEVAHPTRMDRYYLLQRSGDELLDWHEAVAHYAGAWQSVVGGGDHGWEDIDDEIPAMLRFAGAGVP